MYEGICIDYLWLFVGGNWVREEVFSPMHIFKKNVIYKAEMPRRYVYTRFYKSGVCVSSVQLNFICIKHLTMDISYSGFTENRNIKVQSKISTQHSCIEASWECYLAFQLLLQVFLCELQSGTILLDEM